MPYATLPKPCCQALVPRLAAAFSRISDCFWFWIFGECCTHSNRNTCLGTHSTDNALEPSTMVHCSPSGCLQILRQHRLLPLRSTFLPPKCVQDSRWYLKSISFWFYSFLSDVSQCSPPHTIPAPLTAMATGCQGLLLLCHGSMPRFGAWGLGICCSFLLDSSLTTECKWNMVFLRLGRSLQQETLAVC